MYIKVKIGNGKKVHWASIFMRSKTLFVSPLCLVATVDFKEVEGDVTCKTCLREAKKYAL